MEVEATLLEMSGVADAAVASIPHESFGEVPMAFVVRKTDSEITEDQVGLGLEGKLSNSLQ